MPRCRSWKCVNGWLSDLARGIREGRERHAALVDRVAAAEGRARALEDGLFWYTDCQEQGGKAKWTWVGDSVMVECEITTAGVKARYVNGKRV